MTLVERTDDHGRPSYLYRGDGKNISRDCHVRAGSVVVFDYGTNEVIKMRRKPLGRLHQAILKSTRESQTFWIPSEPLVKETVTALMESYGLTLREHSGWGHETKRIPLPGGLAAVLVALPMGSLSRNFNLDLVMQSFKG